MRIRFGGVIPEKDNWFGDFSIKPTITKQWGNLNVGLNIYYFHDPEEVSVFSIELSLLLFRVKLYLQKGW